MRMSKISFSLLATLFVGFLVLPSLPVFSQQMDLPDPEAPAAGAALQVMLGRDSPNLGGNVFRDAFLSFTLSNAPGIATGKLTSDISFPSSVGIAFDRAELTPDAEASGATIESEVAEGEDEVSFPIRKPLQREPLFRSCWGATRPTWEATSSEMPSSPSL